MATYAKMTPDIGAVMKELKLLRAEVRKLSNNLKIEAEISDRYLTVKQAAAAINKSADYVYDMIATGRLGTIRRGPRGNHRISERELHRVFLAGN